MIPASRIGLLFLLVFALAGSTNAEIPRLISYQGKVTDASGTPVPDNNYNMRFRIYNVATGGITSWLWDSGTRIVPPTTQTMARGERSLQ